MGHKITIETDMSIKHLRVGGVENVIGEILKIAEEDYEEIWLAVGGDEYMALTYENKIKGKIPVYKLIEMVQSDEIDELIEMTNGYFDRYTELKILKYNEPKTYKEVMVDMDYVIDYDHAKNNNVYKLWAKE